MQTYIKKFIEFEYKLTSKLLKFFHKSNINSIYKMAYNWHTFWYTNWYTKCKKLHKMNKMKIIEHNILKDIKTKTQYKV